MRRDRLGWLKPPRWFLAISVAVVTLGVLAVFVGRIIEQSGVPLKSTQTVTKTQGPAQASTPPPIRRPVPAHSYHSYFITLHPVPHTSASTRLATPVSVSPSPSPSPSTTPSPSPSISPSPSPIGSGEQS